MARVRLLTDEAREGARGQVVEVSRERAQALVRGGQAERVVERERPIETTARRSR